MNRLISKLTLPALPFAILIFTCSVQQNAHAQEKIIVVGEPSGWCSGPGNEVIYTPGDQLNDCGCADGFDIIDPPDENGQPLCGYDLDGDEGDDNGGPGKPPGSGGGGSTISNTPTPQQCEQLNEECMRDAAALSQNCRDNRTRSNQQNLANGRPCHDQSLEDLVDGFGYRVLWLVYDCTPADFNDITNPDTDNCRTQAIRRGMDRCQWGIDEQSENTGTTTSESFSFTSPVFGTGGDNSHTSSLNINKPFGAGDNQVCMAKGTEATDQCSADLSACMTDAQGGPSSTPKIALSTEKEPAHANTFAKSGFRVFTPLSSSGKSAQSVKDSFELTVNPVDKMAPMSLDERLISQIDRTRLGLLDTNKAVSMRIIRPLQKERLEIPVLYTHRLQFLASWSAFLKRNSISVEKMKAMHDTLRAEQFRLQKAFFTESRIVESVFAVDMRSGEVGSETLRNLLQMYRGRDGLRRQLMLGDQSVIEAATEIFGETVGLDFVNRVWPNMLVFGFSAPFDNRSVLPLVAIDD